MRNTRPVVWPGLVSMCTNADHRLNGEAHAGLRLSDSLVLGVVWHVWCTVEQLVDAVAAVCSDNAAILALCMLLNDITVLAEECPRLD